MCTQPPRVARVRDDILTMLSRLCRHSSESIRMACVFCSCHYKRLLRFSESHAQMTASVRAHAKLSSFYKIPELAQLMYPTCESNLPHATWQRSGCDALWGNLPPFRIYTDGLLLASQSGFSIFLWKSLFHRIYESSPLYPVATTAGWHLGDPVQRKSVCQCAAKLT